MSKSTLTFDITIQAPRQHVWQTMLDLKGYEAWTAAFSEGSTYRGSWDAGARICFVDPSGAGMVSEIAEHQPAVFVSIRHLGEVRQGVEDTSSDAVRAWAPAYENYRFTDTADGGCALQVSLDTADAWADFMRDAYPRALALLKARCEQGA